MALEPTITNDEVTWEVQSDYFADRNAAAQPRTIRSMALSHDGTSVYTGLIQSPTGGASGGEGGTQSVRKVSADVLAVTGTDHVIFGNGMPGGENVTGNGWGPVGGNPIYAGNSANCLAGDRADPPSVDLTGGTCDGPFEAWLATGSSSSPRGLATDDRGNVYVALRDRNDVRIYNSNMTQELSRGDIEPSSPTGVSVWNDNGTYYAYVASGNQLRRWDVTDPENPQLDTGWSAPGITSGAENLTVDEDGTIFLVGGDQVRRISADGQTITHTASIENAADVAVGERPGHAYVIRRTQTNAITVLNKKDLTPTGNNLEVPELGDFTRGSIYQFTAIDISPDGRLYVSEENYIGGNNGIPSYTPPVTSFNPDPQEITGRIYFDRVLVSSQVSQLNVHNTTQDTYHATIQAAIDAADDGDEIEVSAGTYEENLDFSNKNGLSLKGAQAGVSAGVDATTRNETTTVGESIIVGTLGFGGGTPTVNDLYIDGFRLENTALIDNGARINGDLVITNCIVHHTTTYFLISVGTGSGHTLTLSNSNINGQRGFSFENARIDAGTIHNNVFNTTAANLISASALDGIATVTNNEFNGPRGINILTNDNTVTGNTFNTPDGTDNRSFDLYEVTGNTITGNEFVGEGLAFYVRSGGRGEEILDNTIANNNFEGTGGIENTLTKTVVATCNWWDTTVADNIGNMISGSVVFDPWLIDDDIITPTCTGTGTGTAAINKDKNKSYGTIQAAIDDADPGDTIIIPSGDYDEDVTDNKGLKLDLGTSPGCATVTFMTVTNTTTFIIDLKGDDPCTGYDQWNVTGLLDLNDAELEINLDPDYTPAVGKVFEIFKYGSLMGVLSNDKLIKVGNSAFILGYTDGEGSGSITLTTVAPIFKMEIKTTGD